MATMTVGKPASAHTALTTFLGIGIGFFVLVALLLFAMNRQPQVSTAPDRTAVQMSSQEASGGTTHSK